MEKQCGRIFSLNGYPVSKNARLLYSHMRNVIESLIASGKQLPTDHYLSMTNKEMASTLHCSVATARRAFLELREIGLVREYKTSPTDPVRIFVKPSSEMDLS